MRKVGDLAKALNRTAGEVEGWPALKVEKLLIVLDTVSRYQAEQISKHEQG